MKIINPDRSEVTEINQWYHKGKHWVDNRSAKLLAEYWFNKKYNSLIDFLNNNLDMKIKEPDIIYPEKTISFDNFSGPRNQDLFMICKSNISKISISVEAKVDEGFGKYTIGEYYYSSIKKIFNGIKTDAIKRIERLIPSIFKYPYIDGIMNIQYQLFPALAGLMSESFKNNTDINILLIHEFVTSKQDVDLKNILNMHLHNFIYYLCLSNGLKYSEKIGNYIYGPFELKGDDYYNSNGENKKYYIGKYITIINRDKTILT